MFSKTLPIFKYSDKNIESSPLLLEDYSSKNILAPLVLLEVPPLEILEGNLSVSGCENCSNFKEKITISKFGVWGGYCLKLKIGRRFDSDKCEKYEGKKND